MTNLLKIAVNYMCILGGNLGFSRVYLCAIVVPKTWLFTRIKHVLIREISVYLMYILLHNF